MSFIYNKATKVTTECLNADVVRQAKNLPNEYIVKETKKSLDEEIAKITPGEETKKSKSISQMNVEELRALALEKGVDEETITGKNKAELKALIEQADA